MMGERDGCQGSKKGHSIRWMRDIASIFFVELSPYRVLRLIGNIDRNVIKEEIAIRITRHVTDPYTKVGVAEVAGSPWAAPIVGYSAERVGGFCCAQGRGGPGCRPGCATIPRELHADLWGAARSVSARIEAHLNTLDHSGYWYIEIVVVVAVLILASICTGCVIVRAAIAIGCDR